MSCPNCAVLRGEIRTLLYTAGAKVDPVLAIEIGRKLPLGASAARILAALYSTPRVLSTGQLAESTGCGPTSVKVYIRKIRTLLGPDALYTFGLTGYQMTAAGRVKVRGLLGNGVPVAALNDDAETPLPLAIAMLIGRHAHAEGPEATYTIMENIRSALEKQYGRRQT